MTLSAEELERPPDARPAPSAWWLPVVLFAVVATVLWGVVQVSHDHLSRDPKSDPGPLAGEPYIGGWMQYDSGWYVSIAEKGYDADQIAAFKAGQQSAVAYFPGYPLTVRAVARVTDDNYVIAAHLTTVVLGGVVLLLFWLWCGRRMRLRARLAALLALALYPYAWYLYGSGYGDVLFIAATLAAFLLLERDRPVLAGVAGAIASATRFVGVGTIVGLVALTLERRGAVVRRPADGPRRFWQGWTLDRSRLERRDAGVLLSVAGLASYCVFLYVKTGDFVAFNTVQAAPGWNQGTGLKTWSKYSFFALVIRGDKSYALRLLGEALMCLLCVVAIWLMRKRLGPSYTLYTAIIIGIPLIGTSSFQGFGRYAMSAFPVFTVAGELLADRPRVQRAVLIVSGVTLVAMASLFGRSYYLS